MKIRLQPYLIVPEHESKHPQNNQKQKLSNSSKLVPTQNHLTDSPDGFASLNYHITYVYIHTLPHLLRMFCSNLVLES